MSTMFDTTLKQTWLCGQSCVTLWILTNPRACHSIQKLIGFAPYFTFKLRNLILGSYNWKNVIILRHYSPQVLCFANSFTWQGSRRNKYNGRVFVVSSSFGDLLKQNRLWWPSIFIETATEAMTVQERKNLPQILGNKHHKIHSDKFW